MRRLLLLTTLLLLAACDRAGCSPTRRHQPEAGPARQRPQAIDASPALGARPLEDAWDTVDPYCGMRLRRGEAASSARYQGKTYYFCMEDHREAFLRDPMRYLGDTGVLADADPPVDRDGAAASAEAGPEDAAPAQPRLQKVP